MSTAATSDERIQTYGEFWPFYLKEHTLPLNRHLHFVGTTLVIGLAVAAIAAGNGWLAAWMPVAGYGFAWVGHFVVEKNRPATFKYPLWSLVSDFRMYGRMLRGELWS